MKVAVIGGGSTYTPELINGFLTRTESFPLTELWLMDIGPERLEIVKFAQRMVAARAARQAACYRVGRERVGQPGDGGDPSARPWIAGF
jgi:6-phospho-beta-glucosidase